MDTHQRLRRRWSAEVLQALGVVLDTRGERVAPGALVVANHVSWIDILVVNALSPAAFIAKTDVRAWPVIGWLAAKNETVFLRRGSRGHARIVNAEIAALLADGRNVAIFPEGTTTDGSQVLHFHGALLQPAIDAGHPVQPIAITYRTPDGAPCAAPAYYADISLGESLSACVAEPRIVASVTVLPTQAVGPDTNRRALADTLRTMIVAALGHDSEADATVGPGHREPLAAAVRS